ncbi:MAG: PVC-type heme-binding CxxCH protein [Bacteroidota bacterium]
MSRIYFVLFVLAVLIISCYPKKKTAIDQTNSISATQINFAEAPLVSPEESIKKMTLEDGFKIELVAAEPDVSAPVAMNFDDRNRMWVVEMQGYMTDSDGTEENQKNGRIVILEDKNRDGRIDKRKVFIDSLVLPRALCLIENGILIAEPPRLWFIEIKDDKPGKKILVDEAYTEGGNVEAQANGLFRAMDNWIYSGGSEKRYRKAGDKWLTERTHLRGQWGITQDDYGRLYYNNNSQNLLGDYFQPGLGAGNENLQRVRGFNERIISDNRVYPARPTPGVNRGYKDNVLDSAKRLIAFTAACGPALYRGNLFDKQYYNNVFVAEPAANLIKRNTLSGKGFTTEAKQAYQNREFLVSVDERFRPVSLYNGPDGALYVIDMYRGIIQHKSFLTDYLKSEIKKRDLEKPVNCGRIYRIIPKGQVAESVQMPSNPSKLVEMLAHPNGWVRDKAQQMIIDGKYAQTAAKLRKLLSMDSGTIAGIHAMWTMEGLGILNSSDVLPLLQSSDWNVKTQALSVLPSVIDNSNYLQYKPVIEQLVNQTDTLIAPYLAFQISSFQKFDNNTAQSLYKEIVKKYPNNLYVTDAIISGLKGKEASFYKQLLSSRPDTAQLVYAQLRQVISNIKSNESNKDANLLRKQYPRGASLFRSTCQPCHGADGNGVRSLAPPLNKSEWVTGNKETLIAILLHGLSGPVTVNKKLYQAPEINGDMPGIGSNKDIVDEDIAQLSSFIRNSWSNEAEKISREEVIKIRKKFENRQGSFTVAELNGSK